MCMAAMGILGSVMQLGGSLMGASAAAAEGARARQIADKNARLTEEAGRYEARQIRQQARVANSKATVQAASRGLAISGSVLDVMADNAVAGEIDAYNRQKYAQDRAEVQRMEGVAAQERASNRATSILIGGFSNFLRMT